jgi:NADH dehydrogenase
MPSVHVVQADVHHEPSLQALIADSKLVINLAGLLHSDRATPWGKAFDAVHVKLPQRILQLLDKQALIHISALGCLPEDVESAPSMYLRSKSQAEKILLQSGHSISLVRPSVVFGPKDQFLNVFAKLGAFVPVLPLAGAHARFAPVHVHDLCEAICHLAIHRLGRESFMHKRVEGRKALGDWDGKAPLDAKAPLIVEAFGPDHITLAELFRFACEAAHGSSPWIVPLPYPLAYLQARMLEALPGPPLMSVDNLDSMRVDNLPSGKAQVLGVPVNTLATLGIKAKGLEAARDYLQSTPRGR